MKKIFIIVMSFCLMVCFTTTAYAAESEIEGPNTSVSEMLDNLENTQTIVASEKEIVQSMLDNGTLTRDDLNARLLELSLETPETLESLGYAPYQINVIQNYEMGNDAFDHVFSLNGGADITCRYGLAGTGTRSRVIIAFEFTWATCPIFTYTDSIGIGFQACDAQSYPQNVTVVSTSARVDYYQVAIQQGYVGYRNLALTDVKPNTVVGNPVLADVIDMAYGKVISGSIVVETQAASETMEFIEVFIAYYHAVGLPANGDFTLNYAPESSLVSFSKGFSAQEKVFNDSTNFRYNDNNIIVLTQ